MSCTKSCVHNFFYFFIDNSSDSGVHRLHDSSTGHSSPSTRSTQSTGILHTFHPNGPPSNPHTPTRSGSHPPGPGTAIAVVHAMPHSSSSHPQRFIHSLDGPSSISASHHNTRPPDQHPHLGMTLIDSIYRFSLSH